ncbi:MAG: lysophospholipid acyltransferase family protein [Rickettsiales bacterium]
MKQRLNKYWRILATGYSFASFGLGGVILPFIAMPIIYCLPGGAEKREKRAKAFVHYSFRFFVEQMRFLGILTYQVSDRETLNRPGQLIIANHPTLIDIVFLIAFIKRADCVVKSSLLKNPFTRGPINVANYIANDNSEQVLVQAKASLRKGNSLIVFPEGTRTTQGKALNMQRGAANIALRCDCELNPIVIDCRPSTLTKELKWYQIPDRPFHMTLRPGPELDVSSFRQDPVQSRAARQLTRFFETYFTQELLRYD